MKLILSRKGFDTESGGVPSPIFPDFKMLSLPIPDRLSKVAYRDILWGDEGSIGRIVEDLTQSRIRADYGAHLDPDLDPESLPRKPGWKGIFGQTGAAQGHLKKNGVAEGDLFLFFGLFRRVENGPSGLGYAHDSAPEHVIFGWMQIGEIMKVDECCPEDMRWALYHPHLQRGFEPSNTLYLASTGLNLPRFETGRMAGSGVFERYSTGHVLTAPGYGISKWFLPGWFSPIGRRSCLTYHGDLSRWEVCSEGVRLNTVGRGQEFVLDIEDYPEALNWIAELMNG
jgi:hypothetical protein